MADKPKKYCDGIDCAFCSEKEPCIYKIANRLESELKRKEQECEELKEEINQYKQIAQYHGNLSVKYTNKSAKLKQTLTEIKEIAESGCYDNYGIPFIILQKISEVENDK